MLTDHLLDLWRHGGGPDPGLVVRAAEQTGCGLSNAESVSPTQVPSNAADEGLDLRRGLEVPRSRSAEAGLRAERRDASVPTGRDPASGVTIRRWSAGAG